jgi:hypothetical protein
MNGVSIGHLDPVSVRSVKNTMQTICYSFFIATTKRRADGLHLPSGDVVWFNTVAVGAGEMRDPNGAKTAVERLFKDIPTS